MGGDKIEMWSWFAVVDATCTTHPCVIQDSNIASPDKKRGEGVCRPKVIAVPFMSNKYTFVLLI